MSRVKPKHGFVFRFATLDNRARVFVNVCGHDEVGLPVGASGKPVTPEFVTAHGIDNLQVPIAVSELIEDSPDDNAATPTASAAPKVTEVGASPATTSGPAAKKQAKTIYTVDVVVHTCVAEPCSVVWRSSNAVDQLPPERARLVFRVIALAMDWVKRETGVSGKPETIKLAADMYYRKPVMGKVAAARAGMAQAAASLKDATPEQMEQMLREMMGGSAAGPASQQQQQSAGASREAPAASSGATTLDGDGVPNSLRFGSTPAAAGPSTTRNSNSNTTTATKKPMVVDLGTPEEAAKKASQPVMRRGFLNGAKTSLYDEGGTKEGVLPDGAGDPLGYLPKSLRSQCKVIDARDETAAGKALKQQQDSQALLDEMANVGAAYAATGAAQYGGVPAKGAAATGPKAEEAKPTTTEPSAVPPPTTAAELSATGATPAAAAVAPTATSSGITIEDVTDAVAARDTARWRPAVTCDGAGAAYTLSIVVEVAAQPSDPDVSVATMADVDLSVEAGLVECRVASDDDALPGLLLFAVGDPAQRTRGASLHAWGASASAAALATAAGVFALDDGAAKAKFNKAQKRLTITAPLRAL